MLTTTINPELELTDDELATIDTVIEGENEPERFFYFELKRNGKLKSAKPSFTRYHYEEVSF